MSQVYYPNMNWGTAVDSNGGFNTGIDILDGLMTGYFQFEERKQGLELMEAETQQARLENAVSTTQNIQALNGQEAPETIAGVSKNTALMIGGGLLLLVGLAVVLR